MTGNGPAERGARGSIPARGSFAGRMGTVKLWALIMLVEVAIMVAATPLAMALAESQHYAAAASILIASTLLAGSLVFAMWRKLNLAVLQRLAEQRHLADTRRREAEEQAQHKSQLLATMSHEIRTPLNGVIGMLSLVLETELSAEQRNYASIAHGSALSLLSFLDEILDTAKGEALAESRSGPMDFVPFIEAITELMAPRAHAKGIELSALVAAEVPDRIDINQQKLRQILFNLIGNAIKFTSKGGVEVLAGRSGENSLRLEIRDSGIGMTAEELSRIFSDFAQANEDTSRRFGGTGLGLVISKRLVESLGGTLTVSSAPGAGTSFTAILPGVLEETPPERDRPLLGRHYGIAVNEGILAQHLCHKLIALGASVERFDAMKPASHMNLLSGLIADVAATHTLAAARRTNVKLARLPLWVLLAPEDRRSLRDVLAMDHTGYLVKPVRSSSLVARLTDGDELLLASAANDLRGLRPAAKRLAKLRVLLVDDTPVNLLLARTLLVRNGHDVATASSGGEAIALVSRGELFDCVLLDVEMPGVDGHETVRRLRKLEAEKGLARHNVIALTANRTPDDRDACLASGMDGHLVKPFDQHDLLDMLAAIGRRQVA